MLKFSRAGCLVTAILLSGCRVFSSEYREPTVDDNSPTPNDNTAIRFELVNSTVTSSALASPFGVQIRVAALRRQGTSCRNKIEGGRVYYGSCPAIPSEILDIECFPADACTQVLQNQPQATMFTGAQGSVIPVAENVRVRVTADFGGDIEVREIQYVFAPDSSK
jgi:hypothetical protein